MCHSTCPDPSHDCIKCYLVDLKKALENDSIKNN